MVVLYYMTLHPQPLGWTKNGSSCFSSSPQTGVIKTSLLLMQYWMSDELACDTEIRSRSNCSRRRLLCSSWRWRRTSVDMAGICVVVVGVGVGGVVAVVAAA